MQTVLLDRELDAALEVVLVLALVEPLDQGLLVRGRDVVDPHRFAESPEDGLGQLLDPAGLAEGVLDLLLGDRLGVDRHEAAIGLDVVAQQAEQAAVEDHVAVEPQDAARARELECLEQALVGVGRVVERVVDESEVGVGLDDQIELETDHRADPQGRPELLPQVSDLATHDRLAGRERGQWLGVGASETGSHPSHQDHCLERRRLVSHHNDCSTSLAQRPFRSLRGCLRYSLGGAHLSVRCIPAARPLAEITSAILRDASSIISSPIIADPFFPPASEVNHSYASRMFSAWS